MRKNWIFVVLLVATVLLIWRVDKPFVGHHDWNGAFWGSLARDYLRGEFTYFAHYTPALPLMLSASALVFGLSEASLRLVPIVFAVLLVFFIHKIAKLLYGEWVGLVAPILAVATPMFIYFGKLPDHEPIVTSLLAISFYFFLLAQKDKGKAQKFYVVYVLALLESWASFFLLPVLLLARRFLRLGTKTSLFPVMVISVLVIVIHIFLTLYFGGIGAFEEFLRVGVSRLSQQGASVEAGRIMLSQFLITEARYSVIYFTAIIIGLTSIWFLALIVDYLRGRQKESDLYLLLLFLPGVLFVLVFRNLAYIHDYKLYLLLPFVAISAASILGRLRVRRSLVIVLIVAAIFGERLAFLRALVASDANRDGVELGRVISANTFPNEAVLVNSNEFKAYFEVFVTYYADRKVEYGDLTLADFAPDFGGRWRYAVLVDGRTKDLAVAQYLKSNYSSQRFGKFEFFDLGLIQPNSLGN